MNKSKKIWCSRNKTIAWNNYMLKNTLPKNDGNCDTPIEENLELAKKLGISSTPTIILSSGKRIEGALPYEDIVKYIE
jgi:thiol:disulfide interchange protein DsbC